MTNQQPADGPDADGLAVELANLRRIQAVHAEHLGRARKTAELLAAEAAEATEDGIRDLHDDDAEADAAIAAAMVRQFADRAMHAHRRVTELEAMGQALAFGSTSDDAGNRLDIGRLSVIDGDDALLVDWRAAAAMPFYRATPLDRLGIEKRRHLLYGDGVQTDAAALQGYSDEVFAIEGLDSSSSLQGEAALLFAVSAPTEAQMRSVVATIQAEQDAVIRAPSNKPLVVQGGPGTGKTVVALHRAAYLLYDQRADLSESGVLVVGPTNEFLSYIRGVLPSLGETGVVSVTVAKLFPGILLGVDDPPEVARLKGRAVMADLLANAVGDRQRRPSEPLRVYYGSRRVVLPTSDLASIFDVSRRHRTHNEGAQAFRDGVIDALSAAVHNPSFDSTDAADSFAASIDVKRFLLRHWPPLTAEQALNDLLGSNALVRSAASGLALTDDEQTSLFRPRTSEADLQAIRWSEADVALLDELEYLLGGSGVDQADERDMERDEADEFELAVASDERDEAGAGEDRRADADGVKVGRDPLDELDGMPPNEILGNEILGNEILGNEILGNEILGNEILGNEIDALRDDPLFGERVYYPTLAAEPLTAGGFDRFDGDTDAGSVDHDGPEP
jgi:hypothetical protein